MFHAILYTSWECYISCYFVHFVGMTYFMLRRGVVGEGEGSTKILHIFIFLYDSWG